MKVAWYNRNGEAREVLHSPANSGDIALMSDVRIAVRLRHQPEDPVSLSLAGVRGLGEAAVLPHEMLPKPARPKMMGQRD